MFFSKVYLHMWKNVMIKLASTFPYVLDMKNKSVKE